MNRLIGMLTALATGVLLTTPVLTAQSQSESTDLLLTHVRVIDGTGEVHEDAVIAIVGERIQAITSGANSFRATRTIDLAGLTVLPGLIDTHMHFTSGGAGRLAYRNEIYNFNESAR